MLGKKSKAIKILNTEIIEQLFVEDNPETWGATLREYNEILNPKQLDELIEQAKEKTDSKFNDLPFITNPEWVGQIANFVDDDSYITLLKASHDARFKTVKDKTQIDMFEMTFSEYDKFCEITQYAKPQDEGWGRGRRPVINVSWTDVASYIHWLNSKIKKYTYMLPSEEIWNLALIPNIRDKNIKWHFGDNELLLEKYAWYLDNSEGQTHPVGKLKPNDMGLYDMHGNVWEWCEEWSREDDKCKMFSGSMWEDYAEDTYIKEIGGDYHEYKKKNSHLGFRLLRILP